MMRVEYNMGVVLTVNPYAYVKVPTFYVSEWLRAFNFVIAFHFLVSFEEITEVVQSNMLLNTVLVKDVMWYV
jgi:hypothetical protein